MFLAVLCLWFSVALWLRVRMNLNFCFRRNANRACVKKPVYIPAASPRRVEALYVIDRYRGSIRGELSEWALRLSMLLLRASVAPCELDR